MGWFKKTFGFSSQDAMDPFRPEWEKKISSSMGDTSVVTPLAQAAAPAAAAAPDIGRISDEEAESAAQKRLARLGKYFTSPLGVLGNASAASQKVFS